MDFQTVTLKELTSCNIDKASSVEEDWKQFRDAVNRSAETTIGYQSAKRAKKPWVSERMMEKMEERRSYKNLIQRMAKRGLYI